MIIHSCVIAAVFRGKVFWKSNCTVMQFVLLCCIECRLFMTTAVLYAVDSFAEACKISHIRNYKLHSVWHRRQIFFNGVYIVLYVYMHVSDQLPPTLALLIKMLSIVTHPNANSGIVTHTYPTSLAQVAAHI